MLKIKPLLSVALAGSLFVSTASYAEEEAAVEAAAITDPSAHCTYDNNTPIIPDGNVASKDELIAAQGSIKAYQTSLVEFRECLAAVETALNPEAEDFESVKTLLIDRMNKSVDMENQVAEQFNETVRAFKSR